MSTACGNYSTPLEPCESHEVKLLPVRRYPDATTSSALRERLALPPTADPDAGRKLAALSDHRAMMVELEQAQQMKLERDATRLQMRMLLYQWRCTRRTLARQGGLLRQIAAQRNAELEKATVQAEELRLARAELGDRNDLLAERETWRKQSAEQADVRCTTSTLARSHAAVSIAQQAWPCAHALPTPCT
jgi:hypothetical protein